MAPKNRRRSSRLQPLAALALLCAAIVLAVVLASCSSSSSTASPRLLESVLQDDQHLLAPSPAAVARTLDILLGLGVDRVRVTVRWLDIAPSNLSKTRPAGFQASSPASYGEAAWTRYDTLVRLASARGIGVDFDISAAGPLWAMGKGAPNLKDATHWVPSAREFGEFVAALGRRYSGNYTPGGATGGTRAQGGSGAATGPPLPRVSFWSIWNEPNQPGWLLPQWRPTSSGPVPASPLIYRGLADAAVSALRNTGHSSATDTILTGELAPEGSEQPGIDQPIPPMPFLRALYCVDQSYHALAGAQAMQLGCPSRGHGFVAAHPGLFQVSGFAHHPYSFFLPPSAHMVDQNFVPLSGLSRLEHGLDAIFTTYGVSRRLPIYLTEYGYETNPPNPYRGVSLTRQAQYLDEAQYLAWKDPRVKVMTQFLLYDSPPDLHYRPGSIRYWSTFQTGLLFVDGRRKPSFRSYRLPIWMPSASAGRPVLLWGMLRPAPNRTTQRAAIEWRPPGDRFRTLTTVTTNDPVGIFTTTVKLPGAGEVRIAWTSPTGRTFHSRSVAAR